MSLPLDYQYSYIGGYKIIVTKQGKRQVRTHKKRRINKKWAKRYGYYYSKLPIDNDQIFKFGQILIMSEKAYKKLMENEDIINGIDKLDEMRDNYASK